MHLQELNLNRIALSTNFDCTVRDMFACTSIGTIYSIAIEKNNKIKISQSKSIHAL